LTSLDMAGVSLTFTRADDELLRLWDAPVCTPALVW
jgi:dihydroxyacetone kinase-like protein